MLFKNPGFWKTGSVSQPTTQTAMPLSSNVMAVCVLMQVRMNLGKAGMKPETCLSDIKILEGIREDIEAFESSLVPTGSDLD